MGNGVSRHRGDWLVFAGNYGPAEEAMIQLLVYRPEAGKLEQVGEIGGIENPSYLAFDEERDVLYAVSETDDGYTAAYRLDRQALTLREINRQKVEGNTACHATIDPRGDRLHVANYGSASYSVYPIEEGGRLGPLAGQAVHEGRSVNPERQNEPHPHAVFPSPTGRFHLVPDLGIDKVVVYGSDGDGRPVRIAEIDAPAGGGPRHLDFHPSTNLLYVLCELSSQVLVYAYDPESWNAELLQIADMLPAGYSGVSYGADIHVHPSGRYLYASNRGHDSLAVYAIGEDGRLEPRGHVPTGGATPRNFNLLPDGRYLLAANQDSGTIVPFRIGEDGIPVAYGEPLALPKPVCLMAAPLV